VYDYSTDHLVVVNLDGDESLPGGYVNDADDLLRAADAYIAEQTSLFPKSGIVTNLVEFSDKGGVPRLVYYVLYSLELCKCSRQDEPPVMLGIIAASDNLLDGHLAMQIKLNGREITDEKHKSTAKILQRGDPLPGATNRETLWVPTEEAHEILAFHNLLQATNRHSPVHIDGKIDLMSSSIPVTDVLMDSGALQSNYMSEKFFRRHYALLKPYAREVRETVVLGDTKTSKAITQSVRLPMKFQDKDGKYHSFTCSFSIFDTEMDMILGLPCLLTDMREIFMEVFQDTLHFLSAAGKASTSDSDGLCSLTNSYHRDVNKASGPVPNHDNPLHVVKIMIVDSSKRRILTKITSDGKTDYPETECLPDVDIQATAVKHITEALGVIVESSVRLSYTEGRFSSDNRYSVAHVILIDLKYVHGLTDLSSEYKWCETSALQLTPQSDLPFKWVIDGILNVTMQQELSDGQEAQPFLSQDGDAPEDLETDLPVQFAYYLSYMETTHEEAVTTYLSQFEKQVAPAMLARPRVRNMLETLGLEVFVPSNWEGVNGLPPLELDVLPSMPTTLKPGTRPINPRLFQHAKLEYDRLKKYMYEKSYSQIASPLVIAPKATAPFIRFCGDYVKVNQHIRTHHYPIPRVQHQLAKISKYKYYLDLDMANSFHQRRLGPKTSELLSIQTPWGLDKPKFMPEGIGPASGYLQEMVEDIFRGFEDFTIVIFDNFLVCCDSLDDAETKLELILQRCKERNLFLKFTKSWIGFEEVNFFGYRCTNKSYGLTPERQQSIRDIPFPDTLTKMQSFLGMSLFFANFVPNYSQLTARLADTTHRDFNWKDPSSWKHDYLADFNALKEAVSNSLSLFYPDYDLEWVLRTDASELGVGAALFQVYKEDGKEPVYQPISFCSKKFSDAATRWSTIEQEAYGIYFGVQQHSYYLYAKKFILETDHRNLIWIESSVVPKIMRWRVYLQSFTFTLRHIAGKLNIHADFLSRMHNLCRLETPEQMFFLHQMREYSLYALSREAPEKDSPYNATVTSYLSPLTEPETGNAVVPKPFVPPTADECLRQVHGGRMAHHGAQRTWVKLNEKFPGHQIPISYVQDFIKSCAICQKTRLGMTAAVQPVIRHIKPAHQRSAAGIDVLTVSPTDARGYNYCIVIVNLYTKLTQIYPTKDATGKTMALCLFDFLTSYGLVDEIHSDPGSDLSSKVVQELESWFGINHVFGLVDRHTSSGVESTNGRILRHLRALVFDERLREKWSDPTVIPWIKFVLNDSDNSETGVKPFVAHFGSADATYHRLPADLSDKQRTIEFLRLLDSNLSTVLAVSRDFQNGLIADRLAQNPAVQNKYAPSDLILRRTEKLQRPDKLTPVYLGPYQVISHVKNDIACRHLHSNEILTLQAEQVKLYFGTMDEARTAALNDHNQYLIESIVGWKGTPLSRTTCTFKVKWSDGTTSWMPWHRFNITDTKQYEDYIASVPELFPLQYSVADYSKLKINLNARAVSVRAGDKIFLDMRTWGQSWLDSRELPDSDNIQYVCVAKIVRTYPSSAKGKINNKFDFTCPAFGAAEYDGQEDWVQSWGQNKVKPPGAVLVDAAMIAAYPSLLNPN